MKKTIAVFSLALIGLVFAFSGSAWAGRDHHRGHRYEKHFNHGGPYREYRGGHRGRGHYAKPYHHGPRHRFKRHGPKRRIVEKHVHHHYAPKRHFRGKYDYRGDRYHRPKRKIVEKHVYHHYPRKRHYRERHYYREDRYYRGDRYFAAGGLWDPGFFFSFGVSGSR